MVTILLRGGLGNQMFQYGLGLNLALKNASGLELDTIFLEKRRPSKDCAYRKYNLDIFKMGNITTRLTKLSKAAQRGSFPIVWLGADCLRIMAGRLLGGESVLKESGHAFDPAILQKRGNLLILGYWQSEKYFADVEPELRQAFQFKYPLEGEAKKIGDLIQTSNSVSLHVRRGDYVSSKHVEYVMGKTNLSYYEKAASHMNEHCREKGMENPTFFVFSDDINWCKQNLKLSFPTIYLDQKSAGPKASHHLQLMSLCRNNIIANSTFSWWGAWLNPNPEKMVIAPNQWNAHKAMEDIIPQRWVTM